MSIKSYKGFNEDMTCRGFQYEEGKEYETDKAEKGIVGSYLVLADWEGREFKNGKGI